MIIITICIILLLFGIISVKRKWYDAIPFFSIAFGGIGLAICLILLPANRYRVLGQIAQYNATKETICNARAKGINIENAALQLKIIEINRELANVKYYNTTIFKLWIPNEVDDLEFIK